MGTLSFQLDFGVGSPKAALISYKESEAVVVPGFLLFRRKAAAPIVWMGGGGVPAMVVGTGDGRHSVLQRGELKVSVFEANWIATSWFCAQGIPRTMG